MKITKQKIREMIKEELSNQDKDKLLGRVQSLFLHTSIDEAGFAELARVVYDLEKRFPIPEREPQRGEVQFFDRGEE